MKKKNLFLIYKNQQVQNMSHPHDKKDPLSEPTTKIVQFLNQQTNHRYQITRQCTWNSLYERIQLNFQDGQDQSLLHDEIQDLEQQIHTKEKELLSLKQKQDSIKQQLQAIPDQKKAFLTSYDWELLKQFMKERRWVLLNELKRGDVILIMYRQDDFYISSTRNVHEIVKEKESVLRIKYIKNGDDVVAEREVRFDSLPQHWDVFPPDKELCEVYTLFSKKHFNQANIFEL